MQKDFNDMHLFSYDFLKKDTITSQLFNLSTIITDLKSKVEVRKETCSSLFSKLETIAIKESVEGSNAIEGIHTTKDRLEAIVEKGSEPLTHSEEEISGYYKAIQFIKKYYETLSFNEDTIKALHSFITGQKESSYRKEDNLIAEKFSSGEIKRVIFKPVKATETRESLLKLIEAFQIAKGDYDIPALLLIPCVIVDFLSIHPFSDGNGRVSRLLTLLLLYKEGYDIGQYISLEKKINTYKNTYYESLQSSQAGWHESKNDYYSFIVFSFQILYECYKDLNNRFVSTVLKKEKKNERIQSVVLNSIVPISKAEILGLLPDISETTIELVLSRLLREGKIIKIGEFKSAKYLKK